MKTMNYGCLLGIIGLLVLCFSAFVHAEDCNNNGIEDACDMSCGTPGSVCDIPGCGLSADCNGNERPDECDTQLTGTGKITASDGAAGDSFGWDLKISGDIGVVGAPGDDYNGTNNGSVYVFRRNGNSWVEEAKLIPTIPGGITTKFGLSVDIDDNVIVIGAIFEASSGTSYLAAYIYRYENGVWTQEARLLGSSNPPTYMVRYHKSTSISGNTIAIGSYFDSEIATEAGCIHVYEYNGTNWVYNSKLIATDGESRERLGTTTDILGDLIVAGGAGTARAFRRVGGTWVEEKKIEAPYGETSGNFGDYVALSDDVLLIGGIPDGNTSPCSVWFYRYKDSEWSLETKITPPDDWIGAHFGVRVSVDKNTAMVTAGTSTSSGVVSIYKYDGNTWKPHIQIPAEGPYFQQFGCGISVSGGWGFVGANGDGYNANYTGAIYAYLLPEIDCNSNGIPDECEIEQGAVDNYDSNLVPDECDPDCNSNGIPDVCDLDCSTGNCINHPLGCGSSSDYDWDGIPDDCGFADCNNNGIPDVCDLDCSYADCINHPLGCEGSSDYDWDDIPDDCSSVDCNNNGIPDTCDVSCEVADCANFPSGCGSRPDCQGNGVPDDCDITGGTSADYDANGIPDECDDDCNRNGVPDFCDMSCAENCSNHPNGCGSSLDCQSNGIPDDCEVAHVFNRDCNENGVPDECDVGDGTSDDYDNNGIPDECEDCNSNGVADACDTSCSIANCATHPLGCESSPDCNGNLIIDNCEFEARLWTQILAPDGERYDRFGDRVSISGNVAIVSAYFGIYHSNSARIFRHNGFEWSFEQKLQSPVGHVSDYFGSSVAISGDVAVVGDIGDSTLGTKSGAVFVYRFNGSIWVFETKLLADDGQSNNKFGWDVAILGDVIAVEGGGYYVFRFDGDVWNQEAKLATTESHYYDDRYPISVSDNRIVIRGEGESVVVFRYIMETWMQEAILQASDGASNDHFGSALSMSGDAIIVGAYGNDEIYGGAGAAYVFRYDGNEWIEEQKLLAGDGYYSDEFGKQVSISGNRAVIGANNDDDLGYNSGAVYVFQYIGSEWIEFTKLTAVDGEYHDHFGHSVGISNDTVIVGVPRKSALENEAGIAYIYSLPSIDFNTNGIPDECEEGDCNSNGIFDECEVDCSGACANHPLGCGTAFDCNVNGIPDECDINSGISLDCQNNGKPDECEIASGDSKDCQVNGIPDECEFAAGSSVDCNLNTIPDECDLADGISVDYDLSGIPDECETDCNTNGIVDTCDIYCGLGACDTNPLGCGTYVDCNKNLKLDVCELKPMESTKLVASSGAREDYFGGSTSIFSDVAVVGARFDDDLGYNSGSAWVFRNGEENWFQEKKLLADDGLNMQYFGCSVAVSGEVAVVGAYGDGSLGSWSGAAYVFRFNGNDWIQEAKLLAADGAAYDRFGVSIAVYGDIVVVGSPFEDETGNDAGSAYVFRYDGTNWSQEAKLVAEDGNPGGAFGQSVAVFDNLIVCGADRADGDVYTTGAAYVFRNVSNEWNQEAKLTASDGQNSDFFGSSVSVSGDAIIVGAYGSGYSKGAAYVYRFTGGLWHEESKLQASDGNLLERFGWTVSMANDLAAIGAYRVGDQGKDSGAVYIFQHKNHTWLEQTKIVANDSVEQDQLGYSVSMSSGVIIAGAHGDDDRGDNSGSAYIFSLSLKDLNGNGIPDECEIAGDFDSDGDVDLDDWGIFEGCLAGPGVVVGEGCDPTDLDGDGDVDLSDFSMMQDILGSGKSFGDIDGDGNVDLDDFAILVDCLHGPRTIRTDMCGVADLVNDGLVDLLDYSEFQKAFSAAGGR